jgi:hypothetical protein
VVQPAGGGLADAAHADDAHGSPDQVLSQPTARLPGQPAPGAGVVAAFAHAAGGGQQEGDGDVGGRIGQHVGRVAHPHAAGRAGGHVYIIVADGEVADDAQPGGRVQNLGVDDIGQQRD